MTSANYNPDAPEWEDVNRFMWFSVDPSFPDAAQQVVEYADDLGLIRLESQPSLRAQFEVNLIFAVLFAVAAVVFYLVGYELAAGFSAGLCWMLVVSIWKARSA